MLEIIDQTLSTLCMSNIKQYLFPPVETRKFHNWAQLIMQKKIIFQIFMISKFL